MTARTQFRTKTFLVIVDQLLSALRGRHAKYTILEARFNVLHRWWEMEDSELRQAATNLQQTYQQDLEDFGDELVQMKYFFGHDQAVRQPGKLLQRLLCAGLFEIFPNVVVALRIYLTLPSSNASGERSFSCLKRIKNYLRSTLGQERLAALSLLSIECELTRSLNFDNLIHTFASVKARKRPL